MQRHWRFAMVSPGFYEHRFPTSEGKPSIWVKPMWSQKFEGCEDEDESAQQHFRVRLEWVNPNSDTLVHRSTFSSTYGPVTHKLVAPIYHCRKMTQRSLVVIKKHDCERTGTVDSYFHKSLRLNNHGESGQQNRCVWSMLLPPLAF